MIHFRIASFKHDQERSVSYKRVDSTYKLLQEIRRIVEKTSADYVSLRIIRKPAGKLEEKELPSSKMIEQKKL